MEGSILNSIKKLLGLSKDYDAFDTDIIIHINTVFMTLNQLGVGPSDGFSIVDKSAVWKDYILDSKDLEAVKTYIYLKVRLVFDPPLNASVLESMKQTIAELEWRLNVQAESAESEV